MQPTFMVDSFRANIQKEKKKPKLLNFHACSSTSGYQLVWVNH